MIKQKKRLSLSMLLIALPAFIGNAIEEKDGSEPVAKLESRKISLDTSERDPKIKLREVIASDYIKLLETVGMSPIETQILGIKYLSDVKCYQKLYPDIARKDISVIIDNIIRTNQSFYEAEIVIENRMEGLVFNLSDSRLSCFCKDE